MWIGAIRLFNDSCPSYATRKRSFNWWASLEIHRELGKGHDEVIYKDALVVELSRAGTPFSREKNYEIRTRELSCRTTTTPIFVIWDKILLEAKAVEKLTDSHIKQVLNYLAASKLRIGLLVNFGGDALEWKRVIL